MYPSKGDTTDSEIHLRATVLRGGVGIYFDTPFLEPLLDLSGTTNGGALGVGNNPAGSEPVSSAAVGNYVIADDLPIFPPFPVRFRARA